MESKKKIILGGIFGCVILLGVIFGGGYIFLHKDQSFLILPEKLTLETREVNLTEEQRTKLEKEIKDFQEKILQDPTDLNPYWGLALWKNRLGDVRGSAEVYILAIKQNPLFYFGYENLGSNYVEAQEYDRAEMAFKEAIIRNPAQPMPYIKLGELYQYYFPEKEGVMEKYYQEGIGKAITDGHRMLLFQTLAEWYERRSENEKALEYYNKIIAIDPNQKQIQEKVQELQNK